MSWSGIDLILRLEGESPQDAVDRVYENGLQIVITHGVPVVEHTPTADDRDETPDAMDTDTGWMIEAIGLLEAQMPGWSTDRPIEEAAHDDSAGLVVEHAEAPFWVLVTPEYATLNRVRRGPPAPGDWALWWQTAQRFAATGCVVFHPDSSEMLDPSLDAREANTRYGLL